MAFSQQFRALLKFAGFWAVSWALLGTAIAMVRWAASPELSFTSSGLGSWILNHAVAYGALGSISGLYMGLLLAQIERGRRAENITPRRIALWSVLGGTAPAILFTALALLFGAPAAAYLPLLGLGIISATGSGILATSIHMASTRGKLSTAHTERLPPD